MIIRDSRTCFDIILPDDILKARLQTIGVEEHRLVMETGKLMFFVRSGMPECRSIIQDSSATETGQQWVFYDVGGARGQRGEYV